MAFEGFPKRTVTFLAELGENNDKAWFDAHRADYEQGFLAPARAFVEAFGEGMRPVLPALQAQPKVNGSIFRIYRDTRFSKDKRPYKDHLDLWFWQGVGKNKTCAGHYFRITADGVWQGAGIHGFEPAALQAYRSAVLDDARAAALADALAQARSAGAVPGEPELKRVPRGFDRDHPRGALLRRKSLYADHQGPHPDTFHSAAFLETAMARARTLLPLFSWVVDVVEGAKAGS